MSYYDAMREVMDHAIDRDTCNLYFYHIMMGLITKAESEHKFLYDEFMNAKGERTKLRELVADIYAINYPSVVGLDNTCIASNRYDPCERCESVYGEMPCDGLEDPYNELCNPVQAVLLAERMRKLGIEVDDGRTENSAKAL